MERTNRIAQWAEERRPRFLRVHRSRPALSHRHGPHIVQRSGAGRTKTNAARSARQRRAHHEHLTVRQLRLGGIDRCRSKQSRGIRAKRAEAAHGDHKGTRSGCDRRSRFVPRSFYPARSALEKAQDKTRLGTQRRLSPLASVTTADRRKNNRLSKVHNRWPSLRRYIFARPILRRWHAFPRRFRAFGRRAAL